MSQINDLILSVTGGPTLNEGLAVFFGQTADETLVDAERRWLIENGANPRQVNDMWFQLLVNSGYVGTINDMKFQFGEAGGAFDIVFIVDELGNFLVDELGNFLVG